jgi:methyl-accepting chemotaxis protein
MDLDIDTQRIHDHRLLQESLGLVAPVADELVRAFYDQLFHDYPQVRPMFPAVMDLQRERLLKAIIALVTHYDRPEQLMPALTAMGRNHTGYGVRLEHYSAVGATLLATLSTFAGSAWTPEVEGAWTRAYTFAAGAMMNASDISEPDSGQIAA